MSLMRAASDKSKIFSLQQNRLAGIGLAVWCFCCTDKELGDEELMAEEDVEQGENAEKKEDEKPAEEAAAKKAEDGGDASG